MRFNIINLDFNKPWPVKNCWTSKIEKLLLIRQFQFFSKIKKEKEVSKSMYKISSHPRAQARSAINTIRLYQKDKWKIFKCFLHHSFLFFFEQVTQVSTSFSLFWNNLPFLLSNKTKIQPSNFHMPLTVNGAIPLPQGSSPSGSGKGNCRQPYLLIREIGALEFWSP